MKNPHNIFINDQSNNSKQRRRVLSRHKMNEATFAYADMSDSIKK